jgi:hypothetical protein
MATQIKTAMALFLGRGPFRQCTILPRSARLL